MSALVVRWQALPPNLRGILWSGLAGILFALLNVFTLIPAQHLNPFVMAFLRYLFGTLFLVPIVLRLGAHRTMRTHRLPLHLFRGGIHACGMFLWFIGLPLTTLASITALGFTGPIFVTIGAALFLGEDVRLRRWIAVAVGFAGAMIIIRPGIGDLGLGAIVILISTPIFSASNLISKGLARTESAPTIVVWQNITISLAAFPVALWFWQTPQWADLLWFVAAGLCGTLGHMCQQNGYQLADITLLQPIGFLSLLWNALLGYFLFFQQPDVWTFVGAAVIFASAMYISHREAVRRAKVKSAVGPAGPASA
ncbi:MAG: DMT family transporter [Proteobacteria bacterium]|nr:DMT family transporter [Pseudomonadota bacterium]